MENRRQFGRSRALLATATGRRRTTEFRYFAIAARSGAKLTSHALGASALCPPPFLDRNERMLLEIVACGSDKNRDIGGGDAPRRIDRMQRRWRRRELLQDRRQTPGSDRAFDLIGKRAGHADARFRRADCCVDAVDDKGRRKATRFPP